MIFFGSFCGLWDFLLENLKSKYEVLNHLFLWSNFPELFWSVLAMKFFFISQPWWPTFLLTLLIISPCCGPGTKFRPLSLLKAKKTLEEAGQMICLCYVFEMVNVSLYGKPCLKNYLPLKGNIGLICWPSAVDVRKGLIASIRYKEEGEREGEMGFFKITLGTSLLTTDTLYLVLLWKVFFISVQ